MGPYAVYLHERVLLGVPCSGPKRNAIMRYVRDLANDPFRRGDYQDQDDAGHDLQVKIIGDHAISYWADHAVREVKVVNLQSADTEGKL